MYTCKYDPIVSLFFIDFNDSLETQPKNTEKNPQFTIAKFDKIAHFDPFTRSIFESKIKSKENGEMFYLNHRMNDE